MQKSVFWCMNNCQLGAELWYERKWEDDLNEHGAGPIDIIAFCSLQVLIVRDLWADANQ